MLKVPQGWVVLQAANPSPTDQIKPTSPTAEFFVLKDQPALSGTQISNPTASTSGAEPDVQFGFSHGGGQAFQDVTGTIAHRGQQVSIGTTHLFQHFAAALDGQLLSVPQIDFTKYPDGIVNTGSSTAGAQITGSFTTQTAKDLATQLRLGTLPVKLNLISETDVSASLGAEALHKALIAGAVGLGIVVLFLLLYYRLLGLIATTTLFIYAIYFYALIKLIPITLSLAGIAGLVLTIGVAADANIVIFERVKEEIRAGRSIRAGIAIGYKKGLSAIIDANVVTIMVAFILFVLSTQSVQGFAFTLGIGTIVSLFTAVLATQAIMMTVGDTSADGAAVGAGRGQAQAQDHVRLHGQLEVVLHVVRRDPAGRRAGDRWPRAQPRDRLHVRHDGAGHARSQRVHRPRSPASRAPPAPRTRRSSRSARPATSTRSRSRSPARPSRRACVRI